MTLGRTPWVDRHMATLLPQLEEVVPASWMPRMLTSVEQPVFDHNRIVAFETKEFKTPVVEEYGCGHYGCVMPTHEFGLVMKLTTDVTEAAFVARALTLPETYGIVTYKKIFATHGAHRGRPLFVLWRTEARDVGNWDYVHTHGDPAKARYLQDPYVRRVSDEAAVLLNRFMDMARDARKYLLPKLQKIASTHKDDDDISAAVHARRDLLTKAWRAYEDSEPETDTNLTWRYANARGMQKFGIAVRTALYISQEMQGNPSLIYVGQALGHYLEEGLLLADVHGGNLGLSLDSDDRNEAIITDPGHVLEISPRWAEPAQVPFLVEP